MLKLVANLILLAVLVCIFALQVLANNVAVAVPQYDLDVHLSPTTQRLEVTGYVKFPAVELSRESITIKLNKLLGDLRVEALQPTVSAGRASVSKGKASGQNFLWTVQPPRPFPANEPILLQLSYAGGEGVTDIFYLGDDISFALGGSSGSAWYPYMGDARGVGKLRFSAPEGYTVFATGVRHTLPEDAARGQFNFEIENPSLLGFTAGKYTVIQRKGTVPLSAYLLRPRPHIDEYLDKCSKILDLFVEQYGAYPFGEFALVEVPTEQAARANFGGATIAGSVLATSRTLDQKFNFAYYAHEIAHQWWGNLITLSGRRGDFMLDEGMAQFSALLAVEIIEGEGGAEGFRRKGYPGFNSFRDSRQGYLNLAVTGFDHRLSDLPDSYASYWLAYSKAFLVLDMLSRTVGRRRFSSVLRSFTRQHAFQAVTWEQFLQTIERGAGRDLQWFYAQWFERTGAPEFVLTWRQEGNEVRGTITQPAPHYRATLELQFEGNNAQLQTRAVEVGSSQTEFTFPVKFRVRSAVLDPQFKVLRWTPESRAEAMALISYTSGLIKFREGQADQAQEEYQAGLARVPVPDISSVRFMLEYGLARVSTSQKNWKDARIHLEAALASPTRRADTLPSVYLELAKVAYELQDEALLRRAVNDAISADMTVGNSTGAADEARALLTNRRSTQ